MPNDYKVRGQTYTDLADQVRRLRALGRVPLDQPYLNVVDLLHHVVIPALAQVGKVFTIDVFEAKGSRENPASVNLHTRVLRVADWVMTEARQGKLLARLILAHEIGHMVLHRDQEMAFSEAGAFQLNHLLDAESAEWQAHQFALMLLFPDEVAIRYRHLGPEIIETLVGVEAQFIRDRQFEIEKYTKISLREFTGDQCPECHNFTMARTGTSLKCEKCGATNGV